MEVKNNCRYKNNKKIMHIAWVALLLLAIVSLCTGFHTAIQLNESSDMQWSPTRLLPHRINPYEYSLVGNITHQLIMYQIPNYLHTLYLIMLPLGALKWHAAEIVWASLNVFFAFFSVLFLAKKENFTTQQKMIVLLLFLCSTPFRNALGNGQQTLFTFFFVVLSFYAKSYSGYIITTSLAITKYSFAPTILFYEFLKNKLRRLIGVC